MIIRGRQDYIMVVDPCLLWAAVLIKCLCFFSGFGEALLQLFFRVTKFTKDTQSTQRRSGLCGS